MAPANTKKQGSNFDLAIATGIIIALGDIKNKNITKFLEETIFIGELSLDGTIEKVNGILPICIEAKKIGIKNIILSEKNLEEAKIIEGINILPVKNLQEVIEILEENKINSKDEKIYNYKIIEPKYNIDFSEVKGQENVKRALEISAAGGHNCILIGSPRYRKNNVSKKNSNNITRYDNR